MIEENEAKYQEEQRKIQNEKLEQEKRNFLLRRQQEKEEQETKRKEMQSVFDEILKMAKKYTMKYLFENHEGQFNKNHFKQHSFNKCY
jgi:hypothetical protein